MSATSDVSDAHERATRVLQAFGAAAQSASLGRRPARGGAGAAGETRRSSAPRAGEGESRPKRAVAIRIVSRHRRARARVRQIVALQRACAQYQEQLQASERQNFLRGYGAQARRSGRASSDVCSASADGRTCFEKTRGRSREPSCRSHLVGRSRRAERRRRARLARAALYHRERRPRGDFAHRARMRIYDTVVTRNEAPNLKARTAARVETLEVPRLAVSPSRDPAGRTMAARARARRGADWEIFPPRVCRENTAIISTTPRSPSALLAPRACVCPQVPRVLFVARPPSRTASSTHAGSSCLSARNTARGHPRRRAEEARDERPPRRPPLSLSVVLRSAASTIHSA